MLGRERADHAERREVDALDLAGRRPRRRRRRARPSRLRTATTTTRVRRPIGVWTTPSDWKSSTASSIGIGMWSGAASRTAAASAFGSSTTTREVERADDDALVGDAEPHALGQLVLGEERLQRLGQGDGIGDLAVAHDAGPKLGDRAAGQGDGAIDADLGGGEMAGVELEADDAGLGGTLLAEHVQCIGIRARRT